MDITSIAASERPVEINHPGTGEPIGLRVTLRPESDPAVEAVRRKWLNEKLQRRSGRMTAERLEELQLALISAAATGWEWDGELTFNGDKPEFNPANLRKVLRALPWVKSQLDEALGDEAAFFQKSEPS